MRDGLEGFDPGHALAQFCADGRKATGSVLEQKLQMRSSLDQPVNVTALAAGDGFYQWQLQIFLSGKMASPKRCVWFFCKNGVHSLESVLKITLGYLGICDESCLYSEGQERAQQTAYPPRTTPHRMHSPGLHCHLRMLREIHGGTKHSSAVYPSPSLP